MESDLSELWRRLVFSLLAIDYDDHLLRLKASTLDAYATAFENLLMTEARGLLGK
ncbi:MAG: hypothetical protein ACLQVY_16970 [Limisphaerales bacterium]